MKTILGLFLALSVSSTVQAAEVSTEQIAAEVRSDVLKAYEPFTKVTQGETIGAVCHKAAMADASMGNMLFIHNAYSFDATKAFMQENPSYAQIRKEILKNVVDNQALCESGIDSDTAISTIKANSLKAAGSLKNLLQNLESKNK